MIGFLVSSVVAAGLIVFGRWGLRNAEGLVPATASDHRRMKDERSIRRGARSCLAFGGMFIIFGLVVAYDSLLGPH